MKRGQSNFRRFLIMIGLIFLIAFPLIAQDPASPPPVLNLSGNFVFTGMAYDSASSPNIKSIVGIAMPIRSRWLSYSAIQISAVPGTAFKDLFKTSNLVTSIKTGPAYLVYQISPSIALWGLTDAGLAAGGPSPTSTSVPMSGSFAYGGFLDIVINKRWGIDPMIQHDWDAKTGWKILPTFIVRLKL